MELYTYNFSLTRVIDGDTIIGDIDLGFDLILKNQSVRFIGINTPEIRGSSKEDGLLVKKFVTSFLKDKNLIVQSYDRDSFGRVLGEVFYLDLDNYWYSVTDLLLDLNMGVIYK